MCLYVRNRHSFVVDVTDFRGEGITRSKEYLERHGIFDTSQVNGTWSNLNNFNKIRNCLVHCNGNIATYKNKSQIISVVKSTKNIQLDGDDKLVIEKEYVGFVIDEIERFLLEIHKQVFEKNV
ncbi:hypothetical protein SAMN02745127_02949 [Oceanospirillum multiglobuliferum]|uniref:Uncharacterized protein n=1 Tax=Oceanospirillum multiglobuliferum TaxID=64969 RepID=A0A1T4SCN4_9GAMM|nr:hypothetical protein BTE48_11325 [Oceanospirillum multiglobuliferum]SKA25989.1 hypothetical protein SAMN02745127_02949 [Oceanospirillum multiglobuliferum]